MRSSSRLPRLFLSVSLGLLLAGASVSAQRADIEVPSADRLFPLDDTAIERQGAPVVTSYADVVDTASEAVVSVYTSRIVSVMRGGMNPREEMLRRFFGMPTPPRERGAPETEERRVPNGFGSGVIVSPDGYILTNNHVVTDDRGTEADEIIVRLNEEEYDAVLVGRDARTDIAVLKIEVDDPLPALTMADSKNLRVGDLVFAIGNPLRVGKTVTMGIVSAMGRTVGLLGNDGYEAFIQTDASINPGNSGGALVDASGRLVGINTAILSGSGGNIGIGFAVPTALAHNVLVNLVERGTVPRGFLGVSISDLDLDMAEAFQLPSADGALIENVSAGSPADRAGLTRGDVIVTVGGQPIASVTELRLTISQMVPGTETEIGYYRDGERKTVAVELGSLDEPAAVLEGVLLSELTPQLREETNIPEEIEGVIVTDVDVASPFARTLVEGMVLVEVNGEQVRTVDEVGSALRSGVNRLWVYARGSTGYVALRVP